MIAILGFIVYLFSYLSDFGLYWLEMAVSELGGLEEVVFFGWVPKKWWKVGYNKNEMVPRRQVNLVRYEFGQISKAREDGKTAFIEKVPGFWSKMVTYPLQFLRSIGTILNGKENTSNTTIKQILNQWKLKPGTFPKILRLGAPSLPSLPVLSHVHTKSTTKSTKWKP